MTAWCNVTQDSSPYLHAYVNAQRCTARPHSSRRIGINISAHPANALTGAAATCIAKYHTPGLQRVPHLLCILARHRRFKVLPCCFQSRTAKPSCPVFQSKALRDQDQTKAKVVFPAFSLGLACAPTVFSWMCFLVVSWICSMGASKVAQIETCAMHVCGEIESWWGR